ncbi:IS110 family transposase [Azotobacter vinelandii]|uniref:IS110 family transposase n=1 Tax=Azotobacter vinelandii TaxID=354 RepID=UPI002666800E|nr:transposase [Azotobacter vinelandii]WKN20943.1 IS110 family transposase [Azotobacter vinelandii]
MTIVVGIDIAKRQFDIATLQANGKYRTKGNLSNDAAGFQTFGQWLEKYAEPGAWIVMEATNVYHEALAGYAHAARSRVSRQRGQPGAYRQLRAKPVAAGEDRQGRRQADSPVRSAACR